MQYSNKRYAIVNKVTPEIALYFDGVFCLDGSTKSVFPTGNNFYLPEIGREVPNLTLDTNKTAGIDNWIFKKVISIQAAHLFNIHFSGKARIDIDKVADYVQIRKLQYFSDFKEVIINESIEYSDDDIIFYFKNFLIMATTNIFRKTGRYITPVFQDFNNKEWFNSSNFTTPNLQNGIELSLLNLSIIDSNKLEWLHVKEVREDVESIKKLRNLRLFLEDIDSSKGQDYVEDIILQKIESYEIAAKKHGFNLKKDIINAFLDLEHIPNIIALTVLSIFNQSIAPAAAVIGLTEIIGAAKEIGKTTVEIKNKNISKGLDPSHQDVEYLMSIKEKLE